MRLTSSDLLEMKLIDGIVPEPAGGAHLNYEAAIDALRRTLKQALKELAGQTPEQNDRDENLDKCDTLVAPVPQVFTWR